MKFPTIMQDKLKSWNIRDRKKVGAYFDNFVQKIQVDMNTHNHFVHLVDMFQNSNTDWVNMGGLKKTDEDKTEK